MQLVQIKPLQLEFAIHPKIQVNCRTKEEIFEKCILSFEFSKKILVLCFLHTWQLDSVSLPISSRFMLPALDDELLCCGVDRSRT